jgi:hypothetical protein
MREAKIGVSAILTNRNQEEVLVLNHLMTWPLFRKHIFALWEYGTK